MTEKRIALVQFDSVPGAVDRNLSEVERLTAAAVAQGAGWVLFHEATLCDYAPDVNAVAEPVPNGPAVRRMEALAAQHGCRLAFGLIEAEGQRRFITHVFVGPRGYIYSYRKTWLWREPSDEGYRNEWERFDTGTGPESFTFDGVRATCFICADGEAPRLSVRRCW